MYTICSRLSGLRPYTPHITLFTLIIETKSKIFVFFIVFVFYENEITALHLTIFPLATEQLIGRANEHCAPVIDVSITILRMHSTHTYTVMRKGRLNMNINIAMHHTPYTIGPYRLSIDLCQMNATYTHTHIHIYAHTHKY